MNEFTFDDLWESIKEDNLELVNRVDLLTGIIKEITDRRISLHYTQADLAKKCGLKQSAIARMEKLQVVPRLDTVVRVLQALDGSIDISFKSKAVVTSMTYNLPNTQIKKEGFTWNPSSALA